MSSVIGALRVSLGLDTAQFDTRLNKSKQQAGAFSKATAGAFGLVAKSALATLAPILSVSAALGTARAALSDFDRIAKNAKAAGFDGEAFQEFAYSAELGGVSTDEFAKALETFNKNAGLAAEGKGRMVTQLKALNPELLKSILATKDQATRFKIAADAIDRAGSASEKAALASVLFGDSGTRMVEVLKGGSAALAETAQKARDLGLVIGNDLLGKAEVMNDELETATRVMDLQFKQAMLDLAPILVSTAQLAGNLASVINYMTQSMQGLEGRATARLEQDYQSLMATLAEANTEFAPGVVGNMGVQIDPAKQAEMQAEADAIKAELRRRAIAQLTSDLNRPKPVDMSGSGGRSAAAEAAIKQAEAVEKLIADLKFEEEQLGRNSQQQELYNLLKQVGVTRESEFGDRIETTLSSLQAQRSQMEANAEAMQLLGDIGRSAMDGIIDAMADGKIEAEEFGSILTDVTKMAASFFLNQGMSGLFGGGGGLGNLFGGLFGGGGGMKLGFNLPSFDGGGPTGYGARSGGLDGKGGFMAMLHPNETVIDHTKGQGSGPNITIEITGSKQDAAEIAREVRKVLPDAIQSYNRNPLRRS